MHIILHQPEIPANTGNIGRTCVATGTDLHLIEPLGFQLNEKSIKRAGMDYWEHLNVTRYINFEDFKSRHPGARIWMATTKAQHVYTDVSFAQLLEKLRAGGYERIYKTGAVPAGTAACLFNTVLYKVVVPARPLDDMEIVLAPAGVNVGIAGVLFLLPFVMGFQRSCRIALVLFKSQNCVLCH